VFDASRTLVVTVRSAHSFVAGPELAAVPFVVRVRTTLMTLSVVDAEIVVVPAVDDVIVAVQLPVPPDVVQFCAVGVPGPEVIVTVHVVPSGAFTKPVPGLTLTWQVSTWFVPTGFVAVPGVIWMFASTQFLLAFPDPPDAVFCAVPVVRVTTTPLTGMSDVADTTVTPGVADVIVTVQLAVAAPPV
jgi:hypothetical protein